MDARGRRRKGIAGEMKIRNYLRERGFVSDRIPLSGASSLLKGDVRASKGGVDYLIEVKNRASEYNKIFQLYENWVAYGQGGLMISQPTGFVALSSDFERLLAPIDASMWTLTPATCPGTARTVNKIVGMKKLLGEADTLALLGMRKGPLFIRYYV